MSVVAGAGAVALALAGVASPEVGFVPNAASHGASRRALLGSGILGALTASAPPAMALSEDEQRQVALFLEASPSVMGITATPPGQMRNADETPQISGSAFVWDANHVVTNFHVIEDMAQPFLTVKGSDGGRVTHTILPAMVVGADPLTDIAVLQVQDVPGAAAGPGLLKPLRRGSSAALRPGQQVFAIGNPLGLESSMSKGLISGLQRTMPSSGGRTIQHVIQTDTSINPGNSGGPLMNSDGEVIGINAAILSKSGGFAGVSLAIPIDTVEKNVASILENGYVSRASLGVAFAPDEMSEGLEFDGVMVMKTFPGGPAQQAGVIPMRAGHLGDFITAVDGIPIATTDDIYKVMDTKGPGEMIQVTIQRYPTNGEQPDTIQVPVRTAASVPRPPRAVLMSMAQALTSGGADVDVSGLVLGSGMDVSQWGYP